MYFLDHAFDAIKCVTTCFKFSELRIITGKITQMILRKKIENFLMMNI